MSRAGKSLSRSLSRTVLLTTAVSLLVACAGIVYYDRTSFRDSMKSRAETLAEVVGMNAALALGFLDEESATQTLAALSAADAVKAAVIYDQSGEVFASYVGADVEFQAPAVMSPGHAFTSEHLDLRREIVFNDVPVGTIFIRWDTRELRERTVTFLGIVCALLVAVIGVAAVISARLRRRVSRPLAQLVAGSEAVADGDLSVRVNLSSHDEIGLLGRSFNAMSESLRQLVSQVGHGTREVSEVSRMLEESSGSLAYEAQRQSSAISGTAEAVEQVGGSARGVNQSVEKLSESMGETSSSIVEMQASIAEIAAHMDLLASSIETTSTAVSQVAGSSHEVVEGIETLVTVTNDSGTRHEQLRQSVALVKRNAEASHELSDDTSQEAARGLEAVNETIASMAEISESFRELETSVSTLAENSASIDEIVQVIQDVADRTGLLSLNASIIAAQAGEHGKAFSVVADEVSNLAKSTHRSTGQIAQLIRAVQAGTSAAVAAAEAGASKVERGVQRSNVAGEVLRRISDKSRNSAARVHEILEASSQQIGDLQQVDQAMKAVTEMVERFDRLARDQQNAASEINVSIESIRTLGLEVRRSTEEQSRGSSLITNAVTEATALVGEIVKATQAQTKSTEAIDSSLEVFRNVADETNRRAETINQMVSMLSDRSRRLAEEIGRFRTD